MGQLVLMVLGVVLILGMSWGIFVTLRKRQQQQGAQEPVERHDPVIASEAPQETAEAYHVADPYENQPVVGDVSHVTIEQESLNFDPPTEEDTYANERMAAVAQHALDQQTQKAHQAEMDLSDGEADVMSWNDMIQQNLKVRFGQEKQAKVIEMKQAQAMKDAAQPTPLIVLNVTAWILVGFFVWWTQVYSSYGRMDPAVADGGDVKDRLAIEGLVDQGGSAVDIAGTLAASDATLFVFYRGHW